MYTVIGKNILRYVKLMRIFGIPVQYIPNIDCIDLGNGLKLCVSLQ